MFFSLLAYVISDLLGLTARNAVDSIIHKRSFDFIFYPKIKRPTTVPDTLILFPLKSVPCL